MEAYQEHPEYARLGSSTYTISHIRHPPPGLLPRTLAFAPYIQFYIILSCLHVLACPRLCALSSLEAALSSVMHGPLGDTVSIRSTHVLHQSDLQALRGYKGKHEGGRVRQARQPRWFTVFHSHSECGSRPPLSSSLPPSHPRPTAPPSARSTQCVSSSLC